MVGCVRGHATDLWFVRWMTASVPRTAFPCRPRVEGDEVSTPGDVGVSVGLDVGNEEHVADALDDEGGSLFARSIANDEGDRRAVR